MSSTAKPHLGPIRRTNGVAGQVAYAVTTTYSGPAGDPIGDPTTTTFVGSIYGQPGPIVMILGDGYQTHVVDADRFGSTFDAEWVRRFFTSGR